MRNVNSRPARATASWLLALACLASVPVDANADDRRRPSPTPAAKTLTSAQRDAKAIAHLVKKVTKAPSSCRPRKDGANCSDNALTFKVVGRSDLDADGIEDRIVEEESVGISTFLSWTLLHVFAMTADGGVREEHGLYVYSKGGISTNTFEPFSKPELRASAEHRELGSMFGNGQTTSLRFAYVKGTFLEDSYRTKCALAGLTDPRVLRPEVPGIERLTTVDAHEFTQLQKEKGRIEGHDVDLERGGCDNFTLQVFGHAAPSQAGLVGDARRFLELLEKSTTVGAPLRELVARFAEAEPPATGEELTLSDDWKAQLHYSNDEGKRRFVLNLKQEVNPAQQEPWDVLARTNGRGPAAPSTLPGGSGGSVVKDAPF